MELWLAALLLLAAVAGIVLCVRCLRNSRTLCVAGIALFSLVALACAVYLGLAAILLDAARHK